MSSPYLLSYSALWGVVVVLIAIVLHMNKKLLDLNQVLYNMLPKDLPLSHEGIPVGDPFYALDLQDTQGKNILWNKKDTLGSIVLFTSSFCSTCKTVYPLLTQISEKHSQYHFVLVIEGDPEYARHVQEENEIPFQVTSISSEQFHQIGIPATPFAYIMNSELKVGYKGISSTLPAFNMLVEKGSALDSPSSSKKKARFLKGA
ncbi:thiol-disulfide isomerase/thioredoxin [Paenibacillus shirakamiensis]|uniref:Thiol-disulfide isomerase/thioredoxin n=1 Tax=Paenibacillus shirakamiensis TaxID=1265935 RepID=A0ABS4JGV5_9BACL|nr:thioredoxin family protein [Paenibacillus shirakamiensis]MBP2000947.1 thiol-disulfide isomerase/thioredoxin [Paenibacillus shirakamiensis]